jgi:hypothetical protein
MGLGTVVLADPSTWFSGGPSGAMIRRYTAQRDVAGATWGVDTSLGFAVPAVAWQVADLWLQGWAAAAGSALFRKGISPADAEAAINLGLATPTAWLSDACGKRQYAGCMDLMNEYSNRLVPYLRSKPFMAGIDAAGIVRGASANEYWARIFPIASYIDSLPDAVTDAQVVQSAVEEAGKDALKFIAGATGAISKAAGDVFFTALMAFLQPLLVPAAIGVGGWFLLKHVTKGG